MNWRGSQHHFSYRGGTSAIIITAAVAMLLAGVFSITGGGLQWLASSGETSMRRVLTPEAAPAARSSTPGKEDGSQAGARLEPDSAVPVARSIAGGVGAAGIGSADNGGGRIVGPAPVTYALAAALALLSVLGLPGLGQRLQLAMTI